MPHILRLRQNATHGKAVPIVRPVDVNGGFVTRTQFVDELSLTLSRLTDIIVPRAGEAL